MTELLTIKTTYKNDSDLVSININSEILGFLFVVLLIYVMIKGVTLCYGSMAKK